MTSSRQDRHGQDLGMASIDPLEQLRRRRSRVERLADQVRKLDGSRQYLQRAIAEFKAFQPEIERGKIRSLETNAANLSRKIADQEVNEVNLKRRLQDANAAKSSALLVWKYFSAEQKQLRSEATRLAVELSSTKQYLSKDLEALSKVRASINAARKLISDHESFDLSDSEGRLSSLVPEIERLKAGHASENAELIRIETRILPHIQELDRLKSELANLNADITRANRFEQELSFAPNSFHRAMIHKKCEEKFGTGDVLPSLSSFRS
jgi:chromosome segregation ATPase